MRPYQSKTNSLRRLRELGVEIGTILDVGVHEQTPEIRDIFSDKRQILFEPADDFYPAIERNYDGLNYDLVRAAVSNFNGNIPLKKDRFENKEVSHSRIAILDATEDMPSVNCIRLDSLMLERNEKKPYLLKIDVDSVELEILSGCELIWTDISVVVVEITQPTFFERLNFLHERGFELFDLVDIIYNHGMFYQADLIMVSSHVMSLDGLRPWTTKPFEWDKWVPTALYETMIQV